MSTLSALIAEEESPPQDADKSPDVPSPDTVLDQHPSIDELLVEGEVPETDLGRAIDNLMVHWNQLLAHIISDVGSSVPSADHFKEMAEYSVRQVREACLDVTSEFHKAALEWRLNCPDESRQEDLKEMKEAVERQQRLQAMVDDRLEQAGQRLTDAGL